MGGELKTLLVAMHDYAARVEDGTSRWFDLDHVPERMACEGFLSAERFVLTGIELAGWDPNQRWTKYLNVYTIASTDVLTSAAYQAYFKINDGKGTHWRQVQEGYNDSLHLVSPLRGLRSVWRQRPSAWLGPTIFLAPPPRTLLVVLRDVDPAHLDEVNAYLDEEEVPEMLCLPGVLHCERYDACETLPERAKSADIVQPRLMDVYDLSSPEMLTGSAYSFYRATPSARAFETAQWTTVRGTGVYAQRPTPWLVQAVPSSQ